MLKLEQQTIDFFEEKGFFGRTNIKEQGLIFDEFDTQFPNCDENELLDVFVLLIEHNYILCYEDGYKEGYESGVEDGYYDGIYDRDSEDLTNKL